MNLVSSYLGLALLALLAVFLGGAYILAVRKFNKKQQEQEKSLHLLNEIFATTHDGITITDAEGVILEVNPTFTQVTGYTPQEVIGQNPNILSSGRHDKEFYRDYWHCLQEQGVWRGEIWNKRKDGEIYLEWLTCKAIKNVNGEVINYIAIFSDITAHRQQEIRLAHATQHDKLTGLPNTSSLLRTLSKTPPNRKSYWCLLLVDINNFKLVNSSYGFAVGDQLLHNIAKRLQNCMPEGKLSRHSADVFILAVPLNYAAQPSTETQETVNQEVENQEVEKLVNELQACINKPFAVLGRKMEFNFSIGVNLWQDSSQEAAEALQETELALHAAKNKGVGLVRFFSEDLKTSANPLAYLQALRDALANDELTLNFQPLIATKTGNIHALEVLVRWQHPTLGMIPPDQFIPLAERHGLMISLGSWVLNQALATYANWQQEGIAPAKLAVNVSPLEFESPDFVERVLAALAQEKLEPSCLEIELTEGVLVEQGQATLHKLQQLAEAGISLAIDDFGTGYSSLAYLKNLPVNQLKLDRAFVQELPHNRADRAIVGSTLALCHGLKMSVVAEGVETKEQAEYLNRKGCDLLQGYYFSKPLNLEDATELLRRPKFAQFTCVN